MNKHEEYVLERTLILIKPDAIQRGLAGEILTRFERTGLKIAGMKFMRVSQELAERHYGEHAGKPFYPGLIAHITAAPLIALVIEGDFAIKICRKLIGSTLPSEAEAGSIRGDLGVEARRNLVHGSANPEDANREIALFFAEGELIEWDRPLDPWVFLREW